MYDLEEADLSIGSSQVVIRPNAHAGISEPGAEIARRRNLTGPPRRLKVPHRDLNRTRELVLVQYKTKGGIMISGTADAAIRSPLMKKHQGKVQLIFTSPPFPLNRKKKYGNLEGPEFRHWLAGLAPAFARLLKPNGSIVIEMGNAWEPGRPVMSTLALKTLLDFLDSGDLFLCEQFVCYNKARLPTPAQWVNVDRIRVKDAFTHIWWMSTTPRPKANNRKILKAYSASMEKLLSSKSYNPGRRPSEHHIGKTSFLTNNHGAIPSNVLSVTNTRSTDDYLEYCRAHNLPVHPARMPIEVPEFFINFLTEPRDLVLDPFAGSNTTGAAAERLRRRWVSIEPNDGYVEGSKGRFEAVQEPARN